MSYRNFFDRKKIVSPSKPAENAAETGTPGTYKEKTASLPRMGKTKSVSPVLGVGPRSSRRANTLGEGSQPPSAEGYDEKQRKLKLSSITKRFSFRNIGSFFGQKHQNDGGTATAQTSDDEESPTNEDRKEKQLALLHADEQNYEACENDLYALYKELKRLHAAVFYDEDSFDAELVSAEDDLPLEKLRKAIGSCSVIVKALDINWKRYLAARKTWNEVHESLSSELAQAKESVNPKDSEANLLHQSSSEETSVRCTAGTFAVPDD